MNKATLIGRLGRDPEIRNTSNGSRCVSFSLATVERWKDRDGNRKSKTEWHNISIWNEGIGKVAEQYLKKGSMCCVEGKIETREYEDRDGNKRKATEVVIPQFGGYLELLSSKDEDHGSDSDRSEKRESKKAETKGGSTPRLADQLDDDIPFSPEWR